MHEVNPPRCCQHQLCRLAWSLSKPGQACSQLLVPATLCYTAEPGMHSATRSTARCGTLLVDMTCLPEHGAEAHLLEVMTGLTRLLSRSCGA